MVTKHLIKRIDKNQTEIVHQMKALGMSVIDAHNMGDGVPDLVVAYLGETFLVEVKSRHGRLSESQLAFHRKWKGRVNVVKSVKDILTISYQIKAQNWMPSSALLC